MAEQPVLDERIKGRQGYGLVQLIYGNGKGKTTAALGQAIRCVGAGKRALIVYFDKGGTTHYSERKVMVTIPGLSYEATGRDRIDPVTGRFDFAITDIDRSEAVRGLEIVKNALCSDTYDLVVLDEINSTVNLGMLDESALLHVLDAKHDTVEIILTGRNPSAALLERAHLVTEMRLERHYFYSGVQAREGLDY
ncbi:MAG: cob(I)yrinic acid a,c-diamide adenosyltransferase [Candidatus Uhrbacteria bacterium]|nr:cob(I)yrinic acid a,c-diamide adenosyltransferase [Candidatus Uhrbacteria bacterium]